MSLTRLTAWGVPAERIHSEIFGGGPSLMPGVVSSAKRAPHQPAGAPGDGTAGVLRAQRHHGCAGVRRRIGEEQSLLELAEACDVPVRWSCRTGVCHNCESGLISGTVDYQPDPLDAAGGRQHPDLLRARPRR